MTNLTKTSLAKLASRSESATLLIGGKSKISLSPQGAKLILEKIPEAKHSLYNSPREFYSTMREHFGVNWRVSLCN